MFYQTGLSPLIGIFATDFNSIHGPIAVRTYCQNFVIYSAEIPEKKESAESLNIVEADYQQLVEEKNLIDKNTITYITGYLAKKC